MKNTDEITEAMVKAKTLKNDDWFRRKSKGLKSMDVSRRMWKVDQSKRIKVKIDYRKREEAQVDYLKNMPLNLVPSMSAHNEFYLPIDIELHPDDLLSDEEDEFENISDDEESIKDSTELVEDS
jgi:hypothetical protein